MSLEDNNIKIISLGVTRQLTHKPEFIKLMVYQFQIEDNISDYFRENEKVGLFFPDNISKFNEKITAAVSKALELNVNALVFPELSVPKDSIEEIKIIIGNANLLVIAGSYYEKEGEAFVAKCPVIFRGKTYTTCKLTPSRWERGLTSGNEYYIFTDTPIGNFVVLICSDNLSAILKRKVVEKCELENIELDFIIVPAYQPDSGDHFGAIRGFAINNNFFQHYKFYGIYCNQLSKDKLYHSDGRSSFFGMTDETTLNWLIKNKYQEEYQVEKGKLLEIKQNIEHDYFVVKVDINHKEPPRKPTPGQFNMPECFSDKLNSPTKGIKTIGKPDPIIQIEGEIIFPENLSEELEVSVQANKYLCHLINLYNNVSVVNQRGKVNSKTLRQEHIFISPLLYETKDFDILQTSYNRENESTKSKSTRTFGEFINRRLNKIILLGNPGQGKTTLANWIVTAFSCKLLKDQCTHQIPDMSTLKELSLFPLILNCKKILQYNSTSSLRYLVSQCLLQFGEIFSNDMILHAEIMNLVESGRTIFIVDGIEEIKSENVRRYICNSISSIAESYSNNYFVFTSRIFGYSNIQNLVGNGFVHLKIDDFTPEQKMEFIRQFCKFQDLDEREKKILLSEINKPMVEPITRTPLNLTNICIVFSNSGAAGNRRFPKDFKDLYLGSIQLLFERINSTHENIRFTEEILFELAWISYQLSESLDNELTETSFTELIREVRKKHKVSSGISEKKFFYLLVSKVGLFDNVFSTNKSGIEKTAVRFFHESYREFLAGYFIVLLGAMNFTKSNIQLEIIDKLCSQFVVTNITSRLKSKPLSIKGDNFTIVNYAFSVFDIQTKVKIVEMLISNPNGKYKQAQFSARVVLACHCLSNNFIESFDLENCAKKAFAALCNLTVADDLLSENHQSDINKGFRRLEKTRWQETFINVVSESKVALEYLLNCANEDTDEIENLKTMWLKNTELSTKTILASHDYWQNFITSEADFQLLKYSFDLVNAGFDFAYSKEKKQFEVLQEYLPQLINKLMHLLEHNNMHVKSAAAYALSWLSAAAYDDIGIWKPSVLELEELNNRYLNETDLITCRYLYRIIRGESTHWIFNGNLLYQIAEKICANNYEFYFNFNILNDKYTKKLVELFNSSNSSASKREFALGISRCGIKDKAIQTTLIAEWNNLNDTKKIGYALPYFLLCNDKWTNSLIFQNIVLSDNQQDSELASLVLIAATEFDIEKNIKWLEDKWKMKNNLLQHHKQNIELLLKIKRNGKLN